MDQSVLKEAAAKLNIIQNGRFATLLFIIGSFLILIEYNESEKSVFETMFNTTGKDQASDSDAKAAELAEIASLMFLIAVLIYTINAINTAEIELNDLNPDSNTESLLSNITTIKGSNIIAFFDLIKIIGFAGAALGFHINATAVK
ncbi:hypothetical protein N494_03920 [Clostridium botulinum A2B7 92]|uniref:Uncharacterized protein n=1 Tax=Clostridium botulinum TaxID=1491 RepID=A0A846J0K1_CLOBO|nr:hypothetical protein [Clostridium botulinum]ACA55299.1 hypothetical protein CLK_0149 [Clostridium botulinum A3 str. Loch Maree]KEJ00158.1 hypothetical protein N494_03920 [Clostridium botulinum A2B7 92]NFH64173.1 hypothetical protein [Clostridium botulinum]NFJ07248.1 hypothetical protein [Clostridium botulinum]NFK14220.1 hypothetical protein [Clostridium botulinum]